MSTVDDFLAYVEQNGDQRKSERRKKPRQWMGFDDREDFEAIRPQKQKHHQDDEYEDYEPVRDSKRDLRRERRAKQAILERNF
jgi:hypothetical protein